MNVVIYSPNPNIFVDIIIIMQYALRHQDLFSESVITTRGWHNA